MKSCKDNNHSGLCNISEKHTDKVTSHRRYAFCPDDGSALWSKGDVIYCMECGKEINDNAVE